MNNWKYCFENNEQVSLFEEAFDNKLLSDSIKFDIVCTFISMKMEIRKDVILYFVNKMLENKHIKCCDGVLPSLKYFIPALGVQYEQLSNGAKIDMLLKHISFLCTLQKETGRSYDYCACKIKRMIVEEFDNKF
ncbi:MAG: hypothetical protein ACRDDY_03325 [Clostridium sp.]|uniref:hypothetical protein n=1 Tax=Clostridium sp. TaxID=1506 RepID=UPI003EE44CFE